MPWNRIGLVVMAGREGPPPPRRSRRHRRTHLQMRRTMSVVCVFLSPVYRPVVLITARHREQDLLTDTRIITIIIRGCGCCAHEQIKCFWRCLWGTAYSCMQGCFSGWLRGQNSRHYVGYATLNPAVQRICCVQTEFQFSFFNTTPKGKVFNSQHTSFNSM